MRTRCRRCRRKYDGKVVEELWHLRGAVELSICRRCGSDLLRLIQLFATGRLGISANGIPVIDTLAARSAAVAQKRAVSAAYRRGYGDGIRADAEAGL